MGQLVSDIDKPDIVRIARIAGWEVRWGIGQNPLFLSFCQNVEENVGW